jgi:hypothetical protein
MDTMKCVYASKMFILTVFIFAALVSATVLGFFQKLSQDSMFYVIVAPTKAGVQVKDEVNEVRDNNRYTLWSSSFRM